MAKNQNLALNPSKVSGGCGRLLCCLSYENDLYTELRSKLPPRGTRVRSLEDGEIGNIIKGDILNQIVVIETAEGRQVTVSVAQMEVVEAGTETTADDSSEAEAWGEDIDFAALSALGDEGGEPGPGRGRDSQQGSDKGGRGPRPPQGGGRRPRGR